MSTLHHMGVDIQGLLNHYKRKKMNGIVTDKGRKLSDWEARVHLFECLAKGWKVLPVADCEGFDHFGKGCPGHPILETLPQ